MSSAGAGAPVLMHLVDTRSAAVFIPEWTFVTSAGKTISTACSSHSRVVIITRGSWVLQGFRFGLVGTLPPTCNFTPRPYLIKRSASRSVYPSVCGCVCVCGGVCGCVCVSNMHIHAYNHELQKSMTEYKKSRVPLTPPTSWTPSHRPPVRC